MEKTFQLEFNNCEFLEGINRIPSHKGIYAIRVSHKTNDGKLLSRVLYIGKAEEGLSNRINENHEKINPALEIAKKEGGVVTIIYTTKSEELDNDEYLKRIEAALIYKVKPILNDQATKSFNYDKTNIIVIGNCKQDLPINFSLNRS